MYDGRIILFLFKFLCFFALLYVAQRFVFDTKTIILIKGASERVAVLMTSNFTDFTNYLRKIVYFRLRVFCLLFFTRDCRLSFFSARIQPFWNRSPSSSLCPFFLPLLLLLERRRKLIKLLFRPQNRTLTAMLKPRRHSRASISQL